LAAVSKNILLQKIKINVMKWVTIIAASILPVMISGVAGAQQAEVFHNEMPAGAPKAVPAERKQHLNFFIVSKRKKGKLDPASRFDVLRAKTKSFFRPKRFAAIVAKDASQMAAKVLYHLRKYNAMIGTIWFDSHGMYKKGYSLFFIGHDEYNYQNISDTFSNVPFKMLAPYSDFQTKLIIGSCYGGATYYRASIDYKDTTRMNGDSLMIRMGKIFNRARIYGCESWVMSRPGLFLKKPAVAGCPGRKLFRDVCYRPAWENMSTWNEYNAVSNSFNRTGPVSLDMYGNLVLRNSSYTSKKEVKREIAKNIQKLKPGLYK
jgi:hypothetical protein